MEVPQASTYCELATGKLLLWPDHCENAGWAPEIVQYTTLSRVAQPLYQPRAKG